MTVQIDTANAQAARDILAAHWRAGSTLPALPAGLRPTTLEQAYAIQTRVEADSASPLFGWKIAATSKAGQKHINVAGPLAGRLLAERVVPMGEPVRLRANRMRVAEVEFAFRMRDSLGPRIAPYAVAEVMAAVDTLFLAVEVPDSRYENFLIVGAEQIIADNACADQFVLGPEAPALWRALDLAGHRITGAVGKVLHEGSGANVLGDPRIALTWLANELSRFNCTLGAGQVVTTGTCVTPLPIAPGDVVRADYGALGRFDVGFAA